MTFRKWLIVAACTLLCFAAGAFAAFYGYVSFRVNFSNEMKSLTESTGADISAEIAHRITVLRQLRAGMQDEARTLLEEQLDRDIIQLSGKLDDPFPDSRGLAFVTIGKAASYREEHPWEGADPETNRIVREALSRAAKREP